MNCRVIFFPFFFFAVLLAWPIVNRKPISIAIRHFLAMSKCGRNFAPSENTKETNWQCNRHKIFNKENVQNEKCICWKWRATESFYPNISPSAKSIVRWKVFSFLFFSCSLLHFSLTSVENLSVHSKRVQKESEKPMNNLCWR